MVYISPLSAIMMDQTAKFQSAGLSVDFVGESQMDKAACEQIVKGETQLVYVSPENSIPKYCQMLLSPVYKENLIGIAVDEAHCVKTW